MENIITIDKRGKLEIKNSNVKCFLGKEGQYKSSEEIWKELNVNKITKIKSYYSIDDEKYLIIYPIHEKKISIITNDGKLYKSTIYFIDDIKNIIHGLKMENPCYSLEGNYTVFKSENDYGNFLFNIKMNEIKDIKRENIDFADLEKSFNNFQIKDSNILLDINKNIYFYSKIDDIGKEEYFKTIQRTSLHFQLNSFYENKKRDNINDVIYGILGNYASGKSFFLIYYNYITEFPSVYLNLKALKNAFRTEGFQNLINNELMILFYKLKKSFIEFKKFISIFLPYEKQELNNIIISIIDRLKNEEALIILDQYQEEIFKDESFVPKLKKILFSKNAKIKVIISSSMNDGPIIKAYLDIILNNLNLINETEEREENQENEDNQESKEIEDNEISEKDKICEKYKGNTIKDNNKTNNFIPYHFIEKLVDANTIKDIIKEKNLQNNKDFNDNLELLNYLPLYYNLCKQYYNINNTNNTNLKQFIDKTKKRIEENILKINKAEKFNLKYFDYIRKMIDNEITVDDINFYCEYIPFKYFYIEKKDKQMILRTHFSLVKEVWNNIIMKETVNLFDGELKYDGNVIGSLMELNLIIKIKNKVIPLDIDSFIKVDSISNFGKIIESDTDNFNNKNIFITQNQQNGAHFDIAYIEGKNIISPKLTFIQVKKSLLDNKINKEQMYTIFEASKNNFFSLFNYIPNNDKINLIYITLINNQINQAILAHDNYKRNKSKKVSDLGKDVNSVVYSVNQLYNFCFQNSIHLYYYEPKKNLFYIKKNNNFEPSKLDLSIENKNEFNIIFDTSYLINELQANKIYCAKINLDYKENFLNKKRIKPFSYKINEFDMGKVFEFADNYFKNVNIVNYIDLNKTHLDCQYYNLSNSQAIICFKIKGINQEYEVDSFIYKNILIKYENNTFKLCGTPALDRNNDFLVVISFDSICSPLKILLQKK